MFPGASSISSSDTSSIPDCFLPEDSQADRGDPLDEELVMEVLPDPKLPNVLAFPQERPPRWATQPAPAKGITPPEEVEVLKVEDFQEEYTMAFADAKTRLTSLIAGFEVEKREAAQRLEQLELSSETLRFHLERMERVQSAGLSRPRLIKELERGLIALDAAEQDLETEWNRFGLRQEMNAVSEERSSILQEWLLNGKSFALLQIGAFFLPLLIFAIVALILIGTALGWF